jgi:UDPglucose 6-dehydrogenase
MRITMIGAGYVGLVSGACFSDFGHTVTCVDKDAAKIGRLKNGSIPIFEPGLEPMVERNIAAGRLFFETEPGPAIRSADAVFVAVGTPSRRGDGFADLSYVYDAARDIAREMNGFTVVVTKSTVPVGTNDEVEAIIRNNRPDADFAVVSNPEFLREGAAIEDFKRPDRVVVGTEDARARREMADLCEQVGANVQEVARGMGLDRRIGSKFLHAGPGFGGSCFPKDTAALVAIGQRHNSPVRIVDTVIALNDARKAAMADKIVAACGGSVKGKTVAVLGLTFKPNTDDMREAPSLVILPALAAQGAQVRAYDPAGMAEARKLLPDLQTAVDPYACVNGADALVILTEWDQFRALDLGRVKAVMRSPAVVDLRNIYKPDDMAARGFAYVSVGRESVGNTVASAATAPTT